MTKSELLRELDAMSLEIGDCGYYPGRFYTGKRYTKAKLTQLIELYRKLVSAHMAVEDYIKSNMLCNADFQRHWVGSMYNPQVAKANGLTKRELLIWNSIRTF